MFPWYYKKKKSESTGKPKRARKPVDPKKKLDKVFSAYIRLRDTMPNGFFRCISCGQIKPFAQGDCGHYHSRVHMATRWDSDNAHMECTSCNRVKSDHLIGYRRNLLAKIGQARMDTLEMRARTSKHWMEHEMHEMIIRFTSEVKRLVAEKGISVRI